MKKQQNNNQELQEEGKKIRKELEELKGNATQKEEIIELRKEIEQLKGRITEVEIKKEKDRNQKSIIICYHCGRIGHTRRDCRQRRQNMTTCVYCKRKGHNENDCWTKQNRMKSINNNTQEEISKETGHSENRESTK